MPTRVVLLVVSSVALLGFAPAPFPKTDRKRGTDQTDVVGTWAFTIWEYNGQRYEFQEKAYKAKVTRESFDLTPSGGSWTLRLDPSASPPAFAWTMRDRLTHAGCYRLSGDEMTMVFVDGSRKDARPTDLTQCPPNGWRFVMRRVGRD